MIDTIERFFVRNEDAIYVMPNGKKRLVSKYDKKRTTKAIEEYQKEPVSIKNIVAFVNEFLNKATTTNIRTEIDSIDLDNKSHEVIGRAIIAKNCKWKEPKYDKIQRRYTFYDAKYDVIKDTFNLKWANDIVWLKFTEDGYLGVVADSFDINFSYNNTSGTLIRVNEKGKKWNETVVVIFPVTRDLLKNNITRKDIETGIGNFLEDKGVPIIDYFSHNNF